MAVPRILVRQEGRADHPAPSMPVAEPIDPNWWNLFNDPMLTGLEHRVAGENLDVQVATVRIAESRAQLGVVGRGTVSDAERQRLLHAPEGERCRRVRQCAQRARRQRRLGQHHGGIRELASQPVRRLPGWVRRLVGGRPVGQGATVGGVRRPPRWRCLERGAAGTRCSAAWPSSRATTSSCAAPSRCCRSPATTSGSRSRACSLRSSARRAA